MYCVTTSNEKEMLALGAKLAAICLPGVCIFLCGNLGAGKTTWVRGFLSALGVDEHVKSPTYTLAEPYYLSKMHCYHFDLYRLKSPLELEELGIRDYFSGQNICLFEWPEKAEQYLPVPDLTLHIDFIPGKPGRTVSFTAGTKTGQFLIDTLKS